jgi:KDO2-lipid IV(A) lauroyltransferase
VATQSFPESQQSEADLSIPLESELPQPNVVRRSKLPRVEFRLEEAHPFQRLTSIVLAIVISWLVRLMPARARRWLATRLGDYTYRHSDAYRENATENIRQVLGPDVPESVVQESVRSVFRVNARNFNDLLLVPHLDQAEIVKRVNLISGTWSTLDEGMKLGKGVVLVTGHLGPFDFVGQAVLHRGYPLTSVTSRTTSRFLFDGVTFLRRSHDMPIVEASPSGIKNVIQRLRNGEVAVFPTDRDFLGNGRPVTFFGRATTLPEGAVRIARETGSLVVPIFARRTNTGIGMMIGEGFTIEKTSNRNADVDRGLAQVIGALEQAISSAPDQWVMFQKVWP